MDYRSFFQQIIYRIVNPFVLLLLRLGITPNVVTFVGFLGNILAAAFFVLAIFAAQPLAIISCGGVILLLAGLFDMLDGRLARLGNLSSTFGAFWDSTLDRYSELISLSGIAAFFFSTHSTLWGILTLLALIGSIMVSYVRARAEGLGLDCKVGILQRPERVVLLSLGTILCGILSSLLPLYIAIALIAALANLTAFLRIAHVHHLLKD